MPRYDFICPQGCLDKPVEITRSINDDSKYTCPVCGGFLVQFFGDCTFILKGIGFYSTDNNKGSAPK